MATTVKVKFRPSMVKDRPGTIVYLVTHLRSVRLITTKYKIFSCEWDDKRCEIVSDIKNERMCVILSVVQDLKKDMEWLNDIIERLENSGSNYSSDDVVSEFRRIGKENSFFVFMERTIDRLRQLNHTGTAKNYCAALSSFMRFRENRDISIESLDNLIMEDYQTYLNATGLVPNSISFYMRILRAVYNRAIEQNLTKDRRPCRTVFTGVEKTVKRAVPIRDIKRIKELDLSLKPNLVFARDVFLFLFLCRGMSFIDAAFLKKTDIQNGMLTYRRHKTKQELHIKVIRQIRELLERYPNENSPYLLPIISHPGVEERRQYESALHSVNKSLKTIAEMISLPVKLTTYVSRHAWATIAKSKNVPINIISDAMGHNSIATTQIYIASIESSIIDDANELIVSDL